MDWQKLFEPIDVSAAPAEPAPESQPQQVSPGVFDKAASFGMSMAMFAAGGFRTASKDVQEKRQASCRACEHFSSGSCLICGCYVQPKIAMPHEACPFGRWGAES